MPERLFLFLQLEFPWELGPPDGRYLLRSRERDRTARTAPTHPRGRRARGGRGGRGLNTWSC